MRLRRLEILGFGRYANYQVEFSDLNLMYGHNEAGKSTLMAFIYAMFYGFPKNQRTLEKNLRERYRPWSGRDYGGLIEFDLAGRSYQLKRSFGDTPRSDKAQLIDLSNQERVELSNPESPGMELFDLSEEDFLATTMVFDRLLDDNSFSNYQQILAERKLNAYSASDWQAVAAGIQNNRRELMAYRGNGGRYNELRENLTRLEERYQNALLAERGQLELLAEIEAKKCELEGLEGAYKLDQISTELNRRYDLFERAKELEIVEEQLAEAQGDKSNQRIQLTGSSDLSGLESMNLSLKQIDELSELANRFGTSYSELERILDRERELNEADSHLGEKARQTGQALDGLSSRKPIPPRRESKIEEAKLSPVVIICTVLIFVLAVILPIIKSYLLIPGILLALGAFAFIYWQNQEVKKKSFEIQERERAERVEWERRLSDYRRRLDQLAWQRDQLAEEQVSLREKLDLIARDKEAAERKFNLAKADYLYFFESMDAKIPEESELGELYQTILKGRINLEQAARRRAELDGKRSAILRGQSPAQFRLQLEEAKVGLGELEAEARYLSSEVDENLSVSPKSDIELTRRTLNNLERELALSLADKGSAAELRPELRRLRDKLLEMQREIKTYDLALEIGNAAELELKRSGSPKILQLAEQYMARLTRNRYQKIYHREDSGLEMAESKQSLSRAEAYYSSGTRDLMQIALVLGLGELFFSGIEILPLILDDPALRLDRNRKLGLLNELSVLAKRTGRQLIYLTADSEIRNFIGEDWRSQAIN